MSWKTFQLIFYTSQSQEHDSRPGDSSLPEATKKIDLSQYQLRSPERAQKRSRKLSAANISPLSSETTCPPLPLTHSSVSPDEHTDTTSCSSRASVVSGECAHTSLSTSLPTLGLSTARHLRSLRFSPYPHAHPNTHLRHLPRPEDGPIIRLSSPSHSTARNTSFPPGRSSHRLSYNSSLSYPQHSESPTIYHHDSFLDRSVPNNRAISQHRHSPTSLYSDALPQGSSYDGLYSHCDSSPFDDGSILDRYSMTPFGDIPWRGNMFGDNTLVCGPYDELNGISPSLGTDTAIWDGTVGVPTHENMTPTPPSFLPSVDASLNFPRQIHSPCLQPVPHTCLQTPITICLGCCHQVVFANEN